ncbi:MAG TPA: DNA glycosylase [Chloroflexia bacterium]|nr:DNA glycosylase [Chloroflexia bacterium]
MHDGIRDPPGPGAGSLVVPAAQLQLERTLANGQCFRWRRDPARRSAPAGEEHWQGIAGGRVVWLSRPAAIAGGGDRLDYRIQPAGAPAADAAWLRAYLRLDVDLAAIYADWATRDAYLGTLTARLAGLRLIEQDPEECLLSFTCSKANAIPRIQRAIAELSRAWGPPIPGAGPPMYYRFPAAAVIAGLDPQEVAARTGLEWRAASLVEVAAQVAAQPAGWLADLRTANYTTAHAELTRLRGVGAKIADCVCAFALGKDQAVPVDTHVFQVTCDRYLPDLRGKSLTAALYARIAAFWRQHFGPYAGWAQQYLFYDHLLAARRSGRSPAGLE